MKKLLTILFAITTTTLFAQSPFTLGVIDTVLSTELNEKRVINIYLPPEYKDSTQKQYPVIYLLDGAATEDFVHTVGVAQILNIIGFMQPAIIVGIVNVDRERDFTYPAGPNFDPPAAIKKFRKSFPTSGGSAKFISFIEKELQPFIEHRYRTNSSKTLVGQSLGGLLATEILYEKPTLFTHFIIVSPSLWWDNESLIKKYKTNYANTTSSVHLMVGKEGKIMVGDAKKLYKIIAKKTLNSHFTYMPKENHATILHNALYRAFGWNTTH